MLHNLQSECIPAEERLAGFAANCPKVVSKGGSSTDLANLLRFSSFRFDTFPWHPFSFLFHYVWDPKQTQEHHSFSSYIALICINYCFSFVFFSSPTSAWDDHRDIKVHSPYLDLLRIVATPVQAQRGLRDAFIFLICKCNPCPL